MKKNFLLIIGICVTVSTYLNAQQSLKTNEFAIGIVYANIAMLTDSTNTRKDIPWSCYGILTETNPTYLGYPTSPLNQLSADGFNTVYLYQPAIYSYSDSRMATLVELVKNNNMKIFPFASEWFVPLNGQHNDNGFNCYNNDLSGSPLFLTNKPTYRNPLENSKARPNYEYLLNNVYNRIDLKDYIWGHNLGGEFSFLHSLNTGTGTACTGDLTMVSREVPPAFVNEAIGYFKSHAQPNQRICISIVNHGRTYRDGTDDCEWNDATAGAYEVTPVDHDPQEYVSLSNKPDVLFDESYFQFPKTDWWTYPYSNINNNGFACPSHSTSPCNVHYLSKFKNIDYLKTKCNNIQATSTAERFLSGQESNPDQYLAHYNSTNVSNTNWLWFQTYTSIIHGVKGFWYYGGDMYTQAESQPNGIKSIHFGTRRDRYTYPYFAGTYKDFVRHLGRELAYLKKNNYLSTDANTILLSKTDKIDANCIVPAVSSYIPLKYPIGYGPSPSNGTVALSTDLRSENYGLRYTMRTNGSDVILIISNPLNIPITATLNFNTIANPVVRNSTGIQLLFENSNPTFSVVSSSTYKITRNSNIDLVNPNNPTNYQINYTNVNDKKVSLSFGPMDVHIIKFVSNPIANYNNGWNNIWSNFGSGNIDGWTVLPTDKFYAGDFDGDGTEELFCVQSITTNGWAALLKYQNNDWDWLWSNSGNGWINNSNQGWGINAADIFYVGDFDGDGRDELLCVQAVSGGTYMTILKFQNGNWQWQWSNSGNTSAGNGIYTYKLKLTVGDFDKDGKDEVLGVDGNWITLFDYNNNNWQWTWSNSGSTSHMMYDYRNNLKAGDYNGDGRTDILGMYTWATVFYYNNGAWSWGESTYGSNSMGGWTFPAATSDICLTGNIDTYDVKDEIFWLQTGPNAAWATSMNTGGGTYNAGWTTSGNPAYIDDWSLADQNGNNTRYLLIKSNTSSNKQLLAMRKFGCNNFIVNMYTTNSSANKSLTEETNTIGQNTASDFSESILIYPNPSDGKTQIVSNKKIKIIEVYNNLNNVIYKSNYNFESNVLLDISNQPNGIYLFKLTDSENNTSFKKFILNK